MIEPIDRDIVADDIAAVEEELSWLATPPLFFGGSVVPLFIDDPAVQADAPRPTEDVDLLVSIGQMSQSALERELTRRGWMHDQRPRRKNALAFLSAGGIPVDVVLEEQARPDDWVVRAAEAPDTLIVSGRPVRVPTPAFLMASKLQAALDNPARWAGPYSSHDLSDLLVVLFGCTHAMDSLRAAPADLQRFLGDWSRVVLSERGNTWEALIGERPRAFSEEDLEALLMELAGMAETPGS